MYPSRLKSVFSKDDVSRGGESPGARRARASERVDNGGAAERLGGGEK